MNAASGDRFGASVAVSGSLFVAGAPEDGGVGSATLFERQAGAWSRVIQFDANDAAMGDQFGVSVDVAGPTVIVGAPGDDDVGTDSGSVYLFEDLNGFWVPAAKVVAGDGTANMAYGDRGRPDRPTRSSTAGVRRRTRYRRRGRPRLSTRGLPSDARCLGRVAAPVRLGRWRPLRVGHRRGPSRFADRRRRASRFGHRGGARPRAGGQPLADESGAAGQRRLARGRRLWSVGRSHRRRRHRRQPPRRRRIRERVRVRGFVRALEREPR